MKPWVMLTSGFVLGLMGNFTAIHGAEHYPTPVEPVDTASAPYFYTGLVGSPDSWGSGSVAVHPRLVLGCGHVNMAEDDTWHPQGTIDWYWKWNQGDEPGLSDGMALTGYYYFSSYRPNVLKYGMSSPRTFAVDFVANYSATQNTADGTAANWVEDGKTKLTKGTGTKVISGYPSGRYEAGDPYEFRMHSTWFRETMTVDRDNYLGLDGVETGPGNSGGPVWVWSNNAWALAGVLVSGLELLTDGESSMGVCSLNSGCWDRITTALRNFDPTTALLKKTFSLANVPAAIPDQGSVGRTFTVSGMVGLIQGVKLNLSVSHSRQGDLIVSLRGPSGKTVTLLSAVAKSTGSTANLTYTAKVIQGFSNLSANGVWTLTIKDGYRLDTGSIQSGSLEITTR